jgi:hypothetical protein
MLQSLIHVLTCRVSQRRPLFVAVTAPPTKTQDSGITGHPIIT